MKVCVAVKPLGSRAVTVTVPLNRFDLDILTVLPDTGTYCAEVNDPPEIIAV